MANNMPTFYGNKSSINTFTYKIIYEYLVKNAPVNVRMHQNGGANLVRKSAFLNISFKKAPKELL